MAYARWVSYTVLADNFNATIKNASLSWGSSINSTIKTMN